MTLAAFDMTAEPEIQCTMILAPGNGNDCEVCNAREATGAFNIYGVETLACGYCVFQVDEDGFIVLYNG